MYYENRGNMSNKLQEKLKELEKLYGKGTILSGDEKIFDGKVIPTGSLKLDIATGIGGFPIGRIVEIIAPESTGKTTLCLQAVANSQKMGLKAAYIDMEHALDSTYSKRLGVNMRDILISQPDYGEQALDIAKKLIESEEVSIIVIDSVAALVPKSEMDGSVGGSSVGKQARMMSQGLRMLSPIAQKNNCLLLFTNQIRMKIGVMFGSPEVGSGGEAMKFFSSMRIDLRKSVKATDEKNVTFAKVIKNKMAKPFQKVEFDILWGEGVDRIGEIIDLGVDFSIIEKSGSWYSYNGNKIGQGVESVRKLFIDNPEFKEEVERIVIDKSKFVTMGESIEEPAEQETT